MSRKKKREQEEAEATLVRAADDHVLRLTDHPRAQRQIRTAKAWGGLVGFALAFLVSQGAHLGFEASLERAIPASLAGYLLTWAAAVVVWRQLAQAELEVAHQQYLQRLAEEEALAEQDEAESADAPEMAVHAPRR